MEKELVLKVDNCSHHKMSSLEIAKLTGKRHSDVLEAIRNMESAWERIAQRKFSLGSYKDANNQSRPCYELTKTECLYVATKFNDEARAKLVLRWEELERSQSASMTNLPDFTNPADAARAWAEQYDQRRLAESKVSLLEEVTKEQAPKVLFADSIIGSKSSCLIGELAKIITQNGYEIGQNRLFAWMREHHYLGTNGEYYNIPNQKYIEQGLFELKKNAHSENGIMKTTITPKVTGKGQLYFVNKFLKP